MATETAVDIVMPQMGVSVSEGTITRWLKQEGEQIEADEPLLEISTDKVDTEVPSPASGTLTQILVQEGETVDVGTKLGQIGGSATAEAPAASAPEPEAAAAAEPATAEGPAPAPPAPAKEQAPPAKPPAPAPVAAGETLPGETVEPMTAMRRGIAEHMRRSVDTAAHVTSAIEVDFTKIVAARAALKKEFQSAYGVNPTYLAFVARAAVETLKDYPHVNGEMRGDSIVTRNFVNLGIAVELADGKGLIVPVLKNAETLNLLGIAKGVTDLAARARDKKLLPDDVQGGTFTITNPGGYGTFHGTPVISQPQAAILGTYAVVKRPWVVQDEQGQDVIAIRPIMNLTLTYDHRLVDGALAGRFLRDLREKLESWGEDKY